MLRETRFTLRGHEYRLPDVWLAGGSRAEIVERMETWAFQTELSIMDLGRDHDWCAGKRCPCAEVAA